MELHIHMRNQKRILSYTAITVLGIVFDPQEPSSGYANSLSPLQHQPDPDGEPAGFEEEV
jgi:hypothetical protein